MWCNQLPLPSVCICDRKWLRLFALGAEGMMAGALPPAGVYLLSYYQNYHASEFQNGPNQFHVDVNAVVPRLVWMTDQKIMDGQLGFMQPNHWFIKGLK